MYNHRIEPKGSFVRYDCLTGFEPLSGDQTSRYVCITKFECSGGNVGSLHLWTPFMDTLQHFEVKSFHNLALLA